VPVLHAVATHDEETGATTVFAVNRSVDAPLALSADTRALGSVRLVEASSLAGDDPYARNTADDPDRVSPSPNPSAVVDGGTLRALLPPMSWNVIRLSSRP